MNERIKELAEQAGLQPYYDAQEEQMEKFAQLIVKECINICNDTADPHLYRNQDTHLRMAPGASYAAKVIELRFSELKNEHPNRSI
jgi:hypothetical protein